MVQYMSNQWKWQFSAIIMLLKLEQEVDKEFEVRD